MKTATTSDSKFHPNLVLTALASSILTIVFSIIYVALCIVALIFRFDCYHNLTSITGASFFWDILFRVYIQKNTCDVSVIPDELTSSDTVFILVILSLVFSVAALIAACVLITVIRDQNLSNYLSLAAYLYIGLCVAVFVIDLIFSIYLGLDYGYLTDGLETLPGGSPTSYIFDVIRLGALLLMFITLKGIIAHAINIALLILLIVYLVRHQQSLQKNEHAIHHDGVINAYEQPRRQEDPWQPQPEMFLHAAPRNQQLNPAYINDDDLSPLPPTPRTPMRETMPDYSNHRFYDRSESWQRGSPSSSRPFSYIEEPRRPVPMRAPPPAVPAPDYDSPPARRLKSALKPGGYM